MEPVLIQDNKLDDFSLTLLTKWLPKDFACVLLLEL